MAATTLKDIFDKIDALDTYLIESGYERVNDMEIAYFVRDGRPEENPKAIITVTQPHYYNKGE